MGEVGLLGELRAVGGLVRRLREAARLGFRRAIVPRPGRGAAPLELAGLEVVTVGSVREAVALSLDPGAPAIARERRQPEREGRPPAQE
jgi:DNA repair protein RadA/Sms